MGGGYRPVAGRSQRARARPERRPGTPPAMIAPRWPSSSPSSPRPATASATSPVGWPLAAPRRSASRRLPTCSGLVGITLLAAVVGAEPGPPGRPRRSARPAGPAAASASSCSTADWRADGWRSCRPSRRWSPPSCRWSVASSRASARARWRVVGIAAALVAIALVSRSGPMGRPDPESLLVALGSGLGFGGVLPPHLGRPRGGRAVAARHRPAHVRRDRAASFALLPGLPPIVPRHALPLALAAGAARRDRQRDLPAGDAAGPRSRSSP